MPSVRKFFRTLGRIILAFSNRERLTVLLLFGVIIASSLQLMLGEAKTVIQEIKGIYTEGLVGEARLLNPLFVDFNEIDRDLSQLVFSGLMRYDPKQRNFFPDLATYELSEDRRVYTFTVRNGAKWHDGKPVTARDVYYTYHTVIQDPAFKNPILKSTFQGIGIELKDDYHISFTLIAPNSFFISSMLVGIVPEHLLKDIPVEELDSADFNHRPVGSGPYKVDLTPASQAGKYNQINLLRFDEYYGDLPSIARMRFIFYPDWESLLSEKEAHTAISRMSEEQYAANIVADERFTRIKYELPQYTGVFFNLDHPVLTGYATRRALAQAVDREALVKLLGSKKVVDTIRLERSEIDAYAFSKETAEETLDALGWKRGEDGFRVRSDEKLVLRLIARKFSPNTVQEEEAKQMVDFLRNSWEGIGVRIQVLRLEKEEMVAALEDRTYDLLLSGQNLGYNYDNYSYWHSSQTGRTGLNLSNLRSFRIDSLLEDMRTTSDFNKKWAELETLANVLADELSALLLYTPEYTFALEKKYIGFPDQGLAYHADRFSSIQSVTTDAQ